MTNNKPRINVSVQKKIVFGSIVLFVGKVIAFWLTDSVAILTDALESTVNVASGFISLYSLSIAAKPKDLDHPYGHGKVELISASIEGILISVAGVMIIYEAVRRLIEHQEVQQLDYGIIIIGITAVINYLLGWYSIKTGKKNDSIALIAGGRHLQSDAYSTFGLMAGLILLLITNIYWIDSVLALLFGGVIIYTGYKILRTTISGIMDKADFKLLEGLVQIVNKNRKDTWVDIHNLRALKYGGFTHIDCHLTLPWYFNLKEAHDEIDTLMDVINEQFGDRIEMIVHTDWCYDTSCKICQLQNCPERKYAFEKRVEWTLEDVIEYKEHDKV